MDRYILTLKGTQEWARAKILTYCLVRANVNNKVKHVLSKNFQVDFHGWSKLSKNLIRAVFIVSYSYLPEMLALNYLGGREKLI